jgi:hypothetical protein
VQQRAGEGELLVHAAGQRVGAAVAEAGQARDVEKALLAGAHRGGGRPKRWPKNQRFSSTLRSP